MGTGILSIDLAALAANWRALDALSTRETGAVVKADGYGLGAGVVAKTLAQAGARRFFVAMTEEGAAVRQALGQGPEIYVLSGHMAGDTAALRDHLLIPMLNDAAQVARHRAALPEAPYGVQLDTGMNRLGMEAAEWSGLRADLEPGPFTLILSHLACSDDPDHPQNIDQLKVFGDMTAGVQVPRSFSATGGTLLGRAYHFDLTRPGIGVYGGDPFTAAQPVVRLSLPVIQVRHLSRGETVGYGATFTATRPTKIAAVAGGYADGLLRAMGGIGILYAGNVPCPIAGRVSMDSITVDVTHLPEVPEALDILGPHQTINDLAQAAGTICNEILTSFGGRYARRYVGGGV